MADKKRRWNLRHKQTGKDCRFVAWLPTGAMSFEIRRRERGYDEATGGPYKGFSHQFEAWNDKTKEWDDPKVVFPGYPHE